MPGSDLHSVLVSNLQAGVLFGPGSAVDGHMRGVRRANMLVSGLRVV